MFRYPREGRSADTRDLCRAMFRGTTAQVKADNLLHNGCYGIQVPDDDAEVEQTLHSVDLGFSGKYRDDFTGQVLKDSLVKAGCALELKYFNGKGVWRKVKRDYAKARAARTRSRSDV